MMAHCNGSCPRCSRQILLIGHDSPGNYDPVAHMHSTMPMPVMLLEIPSRHRYQPFDTTSLYDVDYSDWRNLERYPMFEKASSDKCWELKGYIPESGPSGGCMTITAKSERTRAERKQKKKALKRAQRRNR